LKSELLAGLDTDQISVAASGRSSLCESALLKFPILNDSKKVRFTTASQHSKSVDRMSLASSKAARGAVAAMHQANDNYTS
jgi:hypothetical protein